MVWLRKVFGPKGKDANAFPFARKGCEEDQRWNDHDGILWRSTRIFSVAEDIFLLKRHSSKLHADEIYLLPSS